MFAAGAGAATGIAASDDEAGRAGEGAMGGSTDAAPRAPAVRDNKRTGVKAIRKRACEEGCIIRSAHPEEAAAVAARRPVARR